MPLDALATEPSRFSADAGAAHGISVNATHDTSPNMTIPGDFDRCRMTIPLLHLDTRPEAASTRRAPKPCQTVDAAAVAGILFA